MHPLLTLLLTVAFASPAIPGKEGKAPDLKPLSGVYEFVYPHNTPDQVENHFIQLDAGKTSATGVYYGTSDDFDDAREGYPPGYFKAPMLDLVLTESTIRFKVEVDLGKFSTKPITPSSKAAGGEAMAVGSGKGERVYAGKIKGSQIILETKDFDPRTFLKRPPKAK